MVFFGSKELPLLCEEPEEVLFCFPLDLESALAVSDFSDLLVDMPEVVVSQETSAQHSQYLALIVRLSTGSNPWVRVPVGRYLHIPNPKPASAGFWRAGNPNPRV